MRSIMVQLRDDQIDQLDRHARKVGASRSQLVRDAVDAVLTARPEPDLAERYAKAYVNGFGADAWGNLDEWHAAAARSRQQRVAGEVVKDTW